MSAICWAVSARSAALVIVPARIALLIRAGLSAPLPTFLSRSVALVFPVWQPVVMHVGGNRALPSRALPGGQVAGGGETEAAAGAANNINNPPLAHSARRSRHRIRVVGRTIARAYSGKLKDRSVHGAAASAPTQNRFMPAWAAMQGSKARRR